MQLSRKNKILNFSFCLFLALLIGLLIGTYLIPSKSKHVFYINPFDNKIEEVTHFLQHYYFEELTINDINDEAIVALLQSLDPFSSYIPKKDAQRYDEALTGKFDGIGIQFNILHDTVLVVNVVPNGPSQKVGLMPGDKIIVVDGETIAGVGIQNEDVIQKLRGKKGTKVSLSVLRSGISKPIDYEIIRDKIPLESINVAYMIDDKIGYILIDNFTITTGDEFTKALNKLLLQNMKQLILDLRGNPGGFLGASLEICDHFFKNKELIVYTQGYHAGKEEYKATRKGLFQNADQQLIILIDEWSASASEIIAGAVQDNDRGLIIGRRSFGKGLVQRQFYLKDSSELMLTVARYYTPSGRCIQKPFDKNLISDYDILDYYKNGELNNMDSSLFADSLKYTTAKGRTVYGGGGIMPDVFIPLKTSDSIVYFNKLASQGIVFTYAMEYVDKNRKRLLQYKTVEQFEKQFTVNENMLREIMNKGAEKGLPVSEATAYSKQEIRKWTKAYIARNLFNMNDFYKIINKDDEVIKKAVEILKKEQNLFSLN